ncbi:MAG: SCO family protein [Bacteroidetes bacterium]|nr:SCO family protein [Bacteroidota bacterium]
MKISIKILLVLFICVSSSLTIANENKSTDVVAHTGKLIPLNLFFTDSNGNKILLKNIINKPTVIDFAYYRCTGICIPLMTEISDVIGKVDLIPGKDYDVISISVDEKETPKIAAQKKNELLGLINKKIDPSAWKFLTGDSLSIKQITDAAGFHFYREGNTIIHKGVLIFVDKEGKICRYLQPGYNIHGDFSILPSDFQLAVLDAESGRPTPTVLNILQTCTGLKKGNIIVFFTLFVTGIFTIVITLFIIKKANPKKSNRK